MGYMKGPGVTKLGQSMSNIAQAKTDFNKPLPHKTGVGKAYDLGTVKVAKALKVK
jgi:hypothetical protein